MNLDRCVFATLTDGAYEGFDPIVVRDACATVSSAAISAAVTELVELLYGFTATSAAILSALPALPTEE